VNEAIAQINAAVGFVLPEVFLIGTVCLMFLAGPFLVTEGGQAGSGLRHRWGTLALLTLGIAWAVWIRSTPAASSGPFRSDALVWFIRGVTLSFGPVLVLLLWNQIDDGHAAEAQACLLSILAGVNFVVLANDLVLLFLGLELVSIPTYFLLYLPRRDRQMREATVKYFLLSIFSSALLLYGLAWLFGLAGTTNLPAIADFAARGGIDGDSSLVRIVLGLLIAGLGFRITAVPFHFYAPDVFQGVTSSAAAMLSFIPKVVGFAALLRLLPLLDAGVLTDWEPQGTLGTTLAIVAIVTMFGGNLLALRQTHVHRLLAYSSVAHAGYMLVGLTVGDAAGASGLSSLLFYLVAYGIMTVGVFAVIAALGRGPNAVQTTADLAGLSRTQPVAALMLAVCLFGLTGLPPTIGFLGKLNLFLSGWSAGTPTGRVLAVALGINAVIAACYYLRLIATVYLDAPRRGTSETGEIPAWIAAGLCSAGTLAAFIAPDWLRWAAERAIAAM
jgi:NADH-quinone oxidoreductase subunit N